MLILLLASAFALSFAPLTQNAVSTTVTVGSITFDSATHKLTVPITSEDLITGSDSTFRVAVFAEAEGGTFLFEKSFEETALDQESNDVVIDLEMNDSLHDLSTLYVDVLETPQGEDEETMLDPATRIPVNFAKVTDVKLVEEEDVKIIFTVEATLGDDLTVVKFTWNDNDFPVSTEEGEGFIYSATMTKAELTESTSSFGYFKGTDVATSSLPFWVPNEEAPALTLAHLDAEQLSGSLEIPENRKAWIKNANDQPTELNTSTPGNNEIPYSFFEEDAIVYFTKTVGDDEVITSLEQKIAKLPELSATFSWVAPDSGDDKTPLLKIEFADELENHKLYLIRASDEKDEDVVDNVVKFSPEDLVSESASIVLVDSSNEPKALPLPLKEAEFALTKGAVVDDSLPLTIEMGTGFYKALPAGMVVKTEAESDWTKATYIPFAWTDETAANKATGTLTVSDWDDSESDIVGYVTENYSDDIPSEVKTLSQKFVIIPRVAPVATLSYHTATHFAVDITIPEGIKAFIETGETELEINQLVEGEEHIYEVPCNAFADDAYIFYKDTQTGTISAKLKIDKLAVLPTPDWIVTAEGEDKTPLLQIEFTEEEDVTGNIILVREEEAPGPKPITDNKVTFELTELLAPGFFGLVNEDVPKALPLAFEKAEFTFTNGTESEGKLSVSFQMGVGAVAEKPESIVVIVDGETDWTKGKAYDLAFIESPAGNLTGMVDVADWKDNKDKDVVVFVTKKIDGDVPAEVVPLSTKTLLFAKVEPKKEDDSAFTGFVSIMALFFSLLVFAF